jgi:hypothetical protein
LPSRIHSTGAAVAAAAPTSREVISATPRLLFVMEFSWFLSAADPAYRVMVR